MWDVKFTGDRKQEGGFAEFYLNYVGCKVDFLIVVFSRTKGFI